MAIGFDESRGNKIRLIVQSKHKNPDNIGVFVLTLRDWCINFTNEE